MLWHRASSADLENIINYLIKDEWKHVQAMSCFTTGKVYKTPLVTKDIIYIRKTNTLISGVLILSAKGLIYPVLSNDILNSQDDKFELIKILGGINYRVHGVIGVEEEVNFLDSVIFKPIRGTFNYFIMKRDSLEKFPTDNSLTIKKATLSDLNILLPLEIEYQKEEVLLNNTIINKRAIKEHFRIKLKDDDIYYVNGNILPLSKGGTTYKTFHYTLLGGIFTWKRERNRGYSTNLLKYIINDQAEKNIKCALFVKRKNSPAIHIYKKLGFTEPTNYKINYYLN